MWLKHYKKLQSNAWLSSLSDRYFDLTHNYSISEVNTQIYKPGSFYKPNWRRIKKYYSFFNVEVYDPSIHQPAQASLDINKLPIKTVKLLLLYSNLGQTSVPIIDVGDVFLCLGSFISIGGDIKLTNKRGETKTANRIWATKFLYKDMIIVYHWDENPKILKAYYNHPTRKRQRPRGFFSNLQKTTLKSFSGFENFCLIK